MIENVATESTKGDHWNYDAAALSAGGYRNPILLFACWWGLTDLSAAASSYEAFA